MMTARIKQTRDRKRITDSKKFSVLLSLSVALSALLALLVIPEAASAQDSCKTIGNNTQWTHDLNALVESIQANDLQTAQILAKSLSNICSNAPTLNYLQGKLAEANNDKSEALYYYQKASENTYRFAIDPDTAKKIWYARYESEHPERTQTAVNSQGEYISALQDRVTSLNEAVTTQ